MADEFDKLNNNDLKAAESTDPASPAEDSGAAEKAPEENKGKRKKLILVIVAFVVIVCAAVAAVIAVTSDGDSEKYTNILVDITLVPGIENGTIISSPPSTITSSDDTETTDTDTTSASDSDSSEESTTSESAETADASDEEDTVSRQLNIYIVLPDGGSISDKLYVYINGELVSETGRDVVLDGTTFWFTTSDSYEGVVTVEAVLEEYGTSATQISTENGTQVVVALPLNSSEENFVPDI